MEHLPIFVTLAGKPCLVVGGGPVAERKVRLLLRAAARVRVVAADATPTLRRWHRNGGIELTLRPFDARVLPGHRLVIAATDDDDLNAVIAAAADEAGVLCNAVDNNTRSGFILPAIVDRSQVVIAIGTGGRAPVLARHLKAQIERWLPARIGELAERAGRWRNVVRRRFATALERRRFWQRFFDGPVADDILAGRVRQADAAVRRWLFDPRQGDGSGSASIVGAGPGNPGLVTLRAQQLLAAADVVLYDRLVSRPVLDMARKEAQMIPVGKSAGSHLMRQSEINALLVRLVRAGHRVCRLKGGDPLVFGRGGEEARVLAAAGLRFEIVPGISAALGCAAYAGIPLTLRGVSAAVTLATARLDGDASPDWPLLAQRGQTLALYMSVAALAEASRRLVREGLPADTPAAVVENGTTSRQRVVLSTLSRIAADATARRIASPAMLFVGESVSEASELGWFVAADGGGPVFDVEAGPATAQSA